MVSDESFYKALIYKLPLRFASGQYSLLPNQKINQIHVTHHADNVSIICFEVLISLLYAFNTILNFFNKKKKTLAYSYIS